MVREGILQVIAMPKVYLTGPRSDMSHCCQSCSLNRLFLSMDEEADMMLSTCTMKIVVPVGV